MRPHGLPLRRWTTAWFWLLFLLLTAGAARAGEHGSRQGPAALYHNYCSVCHGDNGDGQSRARGSLNPPPRDFTTPQAMQALTRDRMLAAVTAGVPGTAMVGWRSQLSESEIAQVVDYVRDTFMRPSLAEDASRGRRLYARICSVCHGDRGAGSMWASANLNPAPRDFSSAAARSELSRERMLAAVAAGRPGTAMSGYAGKLNAEDMAAVVDYIRGAFMRGDAAANTAGISGTHAHGVPAAGAVAPGAHPGLALPAGAHPSMARGADPGPVPGPMADHTLPLPQGLKGDAQAGRRFYDANCATCHGVKGDGKGPRAYFINPKPRNFLSAESRRFLNRPALYAGVSAGKRGTEMPAWDKVLSAQDMADVAEYVHTRFIQPRGGRAR